MKRKVSLVLIAALLVGMTGLLGSAPALACHNRYGYYGDRGFGNNYMLNSAFGSFGGNYWAQRQARRAARRAARMARRAGMLNFGSPYSMSYAGYYNPYRYNMGYNSFGYGNPYTSSVMGRILRAF